MMGGVVDEAVARLEAEGRARAEARLKKMWTWEIALLAEGYMPDDPLPVAVGQRAMRLRRIANREQHMLVPSADPGSQIVKDDSRQAARDHGDLTVEHQATVRLLAAFSHLAAHAHEYLHRGEAPVFYPHAEFSVLRGALEAASIARWLLEPDESKERVLRALGAKAKEAKFEVQAVEKAGLDEGKAEDFSDKVGKGPESG